MPTITLIRHGRPTVALDGHACAAEFGHIVSRYNQSGICDTPPAAAIQQARQCKFIVSSDLSRAIESSRALGFTTIHLSDPTFREVAMPYFNRGSFRMSLGKWGALFRVLSVFGFSSNGESLGMAKRRASTAASTVIDLAHRHDSILLVGHGFINYFIARELRARHWRGPGKPGKHFWDYGVYCTGKA